MSNLNKKSALDSVKKALFDNKVILLFVALSVICMLIADTNVAYVASEVASRFTRNTCIVLALIIPCMAGLGMNFGIVVGAIAAQISIFWVVHWGFTGISGFMLTVAMSTPLALLFGWLLGKFFNKTKGAEMIAGLVLGFFAAGLYRLFVLYIMGGVIPFDDPNLLERGFGLRNAFDLTGNLKYALDDISLLATLAVLGGVNLLATLVVAAYDKKQGKAVDSKKVTAKAIGSAAALVVQETMDEAFLEEVNAKGAYLRQQIEALNLPCFGKTRGLGLMIGIEVKDGYTKGEIANKLIENGLLVLTAGPGMRLLPPLVITKEEMDKGLAIMKKVLG